MVISEKLLIEVFYLKGTPAFICGVNGKTTVTCLGEIEDSLNEGDEGDSLLFDKGEGSYFFTAYYEPAQIGFEGRTELAPYWGVDFVRFEPLPNEVPDGV